MHGRTREQSFSGIADWSTIRKVKKALNIPVIANGDIYNTNDALRCLAISGADGIMIGRGSLGSPWLVGQIDAYLRGEPTINTPSPKAKVDIAIEQLQRLVEKKGDHGLLIARKHMNWTCKGFPSAKALRHSLMKAKTPLEAKTLLEKELTLLEQANCN